MSFRELTLTTNQVTEDGEITEQIFEVTISPMTVKYVQAATCKIAGHEQKKTVYVYFVDDPEPLPLLLTEGDLMNLRRAVGTYEFDY